jgi:citronellol/citronellal dehydrogenase
MQSVKKNFSYVLKSIKKDTSLKPILNDLQGKTYVVSGASRGIGLSIAKKISELGGNVAILGKTSEPHPKLEGTISTAVEDIKSVNQYSNDNVLGLVCDIRENNQIDESIEKVINKFGTIDGVILNASALCLRSTLDQTHKEIDLMSGVNINGTFKVGKECLKYIDKSKHGNVLIISPPIDMLYNDDWWINHLYYSMSKFNMSLISKYWDKEFPNIGVNTLWPRTTIATAPVKNLLGGNEMINISRKPEIMGDAASYILRADPKLCSGKNFIDDEVLASVDIDVEKYRLNPEIKEKDLMPDFFC